MIELIQRHTISFFVLVLLQVLVLNNIQLSGYINPYLYVMFIILLPFETRGWFLLVTALVLGFCIDVFSNTIGIHSAATVAMAFVRPAVLNVMAPRDGYDKNTQPHIKFYGFTWFLKYALVLVIVHHLFLFYMEVFSFKYFFTTFFRALSNICVTMTLVVVCQYITYKR